MMFYCVFPFIQLFTEGFFKAKIIKQLPIWLLVFDNEASGRSNSVAWRKQISKNQSDERIWAN
jgi:hypothetical protein